MSSVCNRLDFKDAESHLESSSASSPSKCSNGSCIGSEDAQESDGDDVSGYIHHHVNQESKDKAISKPIPQSLPLESDGDDSGYIHHHVNQESKDKAISKPIPQSLPLESFDDEGEDKNLATALQDMFSESMSVVTLIPAIKGGREKHGKSVEKLRVSWAEDVYDPPPSIVSHTRSKKQQPQKSKSKDNLKKNGKKGSSNSRGSKDKKQSTSSRNSKYNRDKFDWATQMSIIAASS